MITKTAEHDSFVEPIVSVSAQTSDSKENAEQDFLPAEKAKKMTDSMNKFLETTNTELRFKYHEKLNMYYVTLIDSKTDEVVREIPSKKMLDMYAAMQDFMGLFVDKKI
ncbi:flagellar protein FlaG [Psychrobacillus glaciei]|uniref:Flagellar protein FlaG n=2 Tax=Psychrobacillus glaciei TaxID=2283160 RepID=A0A5J6SU87_9BACI|nr:flagellar protein FlaG [Psychrobacillus glaciei]